jgi:hypothetical protein
VVLKYPAVVVMEALYSTTSLLVLALSEVEYFEALEIRNKIMHN